MASKVQADEVADESEEEKPKPLKRSSAHLPVAVEGRPKGRARTSLPKGKARGKPKQALKRSKLQCRGCWKWFSIEEIQPGQCYCNSDLQAKQNTRNAAVRSGKLQWWQTQMDDDELRTQMFEAYHVACPINPNGARKPFQVLIYIESIKTIKAAYFDFVYEFMTESKFMDWSQSPEGGRKPFHVAAQLWIKFKEHPERVENHDDNELEIAIPVKKLMIKRTGQERSKSMNLQGQAKKNPQEKDITKELRDVTSGMDNIAGVQSADSDMHAMVQQLNASGGSMDGNNFAAGQLIDQLQNIERCAEKGADGAAGASGDDAEKEEADEEADEDDDAATSRAAEKGALPISDISRNKAVRAHGEWCLKTKATIDQVFDEFNATKKAVEELGPDMMEQVGKEMKVATRYFDGLEACMELDATRLDEYRNTFGESVAIPPQDSAGSITGSSPTKVAPIQPPITNMDKLMIFSFFKSKAEEIEGVVLRSELSEIKTSMKDAKNRLSALVGACKAAAKQVKNLLDKELEKRKNKVKKEKEDAKKRKAEEQAGKSASIKRVKTEEIKPLWKFGVELATEVQCYSQAELAGMDPLNKAAAINAHNPFAILLKPEISLMQKGMVMDELDHFKDKFKRNSEEKRGLGVATASGKDILACIEQEVLDGNPLVKTEPPKGSDLHECLQPSFFLVSKNYDNVGGERFFTACFRLLVRGNRELLLFGFMDLVHFLVKKGWQADKLAPKDVWKAVKKMSQPDLTEFAANSKIWHLTCDPRTCIYIPASMVFAERTSEAVDALGIRIGVAKTSTFAKTCLGQTYTHLSKLDPMPQAVKDNLPSVQAYLGLVS